jgi:hypothetical protein
VLPVIVTLPLARIVTGVFAAFLTKVRVIPVGTETVVKFKTPSAKPPAGVFGRVAVVPLGWKVTTPVFRSRTIPVVPVGGVMGGNAPFAPVLPLEKLWADTGTAANVKIPRSRKQSKGHVPHDVRGGSPDAF